MLSKLSSSWAYSNPKWFEEAHPKGVRFLKPQKKQMISRQFGESEKR